MNNNEQLLPVLAAVEQATGQRPHPSTLQRWRLRGVAGVKLETVRCGGRRMCTVSAVEKFLAQVTAASDGDTNPTKVRTPRQRQRDVAWAEAELEKAEI